MSDPCFMVEARHPRRFAVVRCDYLHGPDEPCNRKGLRIETRSQVVRTDSGEVIAEDCTSLTAGAVLTPGAMFWQEMTQSTPPRGPEDWPSGTVDADVYAVMTNEQRHALPRPAMVRRGQEPRSPSYLFADGPQLTVICPGPGVWVIDSRASNCTMPYDYEHRCWIRHGEPPLITVDKSGGPTCAAGAGSIQCGSYHGFLQGGVLT